MKALLFAAALFAVALDGHAGKYPREAVVKVEQIAPFLLGVGATGSAVIVQPGLVLSARHMHEPGMSIAGAPWAYVSAPKGEGLDVAAFRLPGIDCPCVEFATSDARLDEPVIIIGFPLGVASTVTHGESQGVHDIPRIGPRLIVTALVEGGNSGGGAFVMRDGRWQFVGILAEGSHVQALVVPVSEISKWLWDGENAGP